MNRPDHKTATRIDDELTFVNNNEAKPVGRVSCTKRQFEVRTVETRVMATDLHIQDGADGVATETNNSLTRYTAALASLLELLVDDDKCGS
jgi:hypothetical protein